MVFVHAKIGELKVKDLSQKLQGISGFIFHLQLCEGQQLKHQILLKSHTEWVTLGSIQPKLAVLADVALTALLFGSNKEREAEMDHSDVSIWSVRRHRASQRECRSVESFRCALSQRYLLLLSFVFLSFLRYIPGPVHQKLSGPGARWVNAGKSWHPSC